MLFIPGFKTILNRRVYINSKHYVSLQPYTISAKTFRELLAKLNIDAGKCLFAHQQKNKNSSGFLYIKKNATKVGKNWTAEIGIGII